MESNPSSFNKKLFSELLLKIKGNRTLTKFAEETHSSIAHLSRMINEKLDSPPSPETIKKLLFNKYGEVTYEELMVAAGYIESEMNLDEEDLEANDALDYPSDSLRNGASMNEHSGEVKKYKSLSMSTILLTLSCKNYAWHITNGSDIVSSFQNTFSLDLPEAYIDSWIFELRYMKPLKNSEKYLHYQLKRTVKDTWGRLAMTSIEPCSKYSLVTDYEILYDAFIESSPRNLDLTISIILVDPEELKVLKEEYVSYYHKIDIHKMQELILS